MARDSKRGASKTGKRLTLTYRQKVLKLYPTAEFDYGRICYRKRFIGSQYYETYILSDGNYGDSKKAWKEAWQQILQDMLEEFEES